MTLVKRVSVGLLRLLIGTGFTFSLVVGVTLMMLTLCDGSGSNLTLAQTGLHWEWSIPAVAAFTFTLICWLGWRCLPAVKPAQVLPTFERDFQTPGMVLACAVSGLLLTSYGAVDMGLRVFSHAAGGSWVRFAFYFLSATSNGLVIASAWKQRKKNISSRTCSERWYTPK